VTSDVLYFPFIRVPESDWLTRMLLYWDHVRTITPSAFRREPERFGTYTQSLVREELVVPVYPGEYVHGLPRFEDEFLAFLGSNESEIDRRRAGFVQGSHAPIHLEKLGALEKGLTDLRLARRDGNWSLVETNTAEEFMTYLATVLGKLPEVRSIPVSDQLAGTARLAARSPSVSMDARLSSLRTAVLENVFPAPIRPLKAEEIASFKRRHGDLLSRFRLAVENEIIRLADLQDATLRHAARENLAARIEQDVIEIEAKLGEFGFGKTSCSSWLAVLGNGPVAGSAFSVLSSVLALFERQGESPIGPFAYAGYARARLLDG
jgi:hypothetical protein